MSATRPLLYYTNSLSCLSQTQQVGPSCIRNAGKPERKSIAKSMSHETLNKNLLTVLVLFRLPFSSFVAEGDDVEAVVAAEVVEDRDHRVLHLLKLLALHRAADVQHEDQVLRQRRQLLVGEEVNEVAVLKLAQRV